MWQHKWALWSGFLGATASCFVKMGTGSTKSSPLLRFVEANICESTLVRKWLADLDGDLLRIIHRVLGELMIKYRINLMPTWRIIRTKLIEEFAYRLYLFEIDYCQLFIVLPIRVICIAAMIISNAYMLASFLKGMRESGSVVGTSLSTAANFTSSAIYGKLLWDEPMNTIWCLGFGCVLSGVVILSSLTTAETADDTKKVSRTKASKQLQVEIPKERNPKSPSVAKKKTPPLKIHTKPRNSDGITKTKVASLRSSFETDRVPSPRTTHDIPYQKPKPITPSPQEVHTPIFSKPTSFQPLSSSKKTKSKEDLKSEFDLKQFYDFTKISSSSSQTLVDRSFPNECALCDGLLFNRTTGQSRDAVADLSANTCFHVFHSRCLKQASKAYGNACPLCQTPLAMWTASKEAAQFPGFWLELVERYLKGLNGPPQAAPSGKDACLPARKIREHFQSSSDLTESQKIYIKDDPTGMDKGLQAALEWGGYVDYNQVPKGHVGFSPALRTRGIWKYDTKKDDIWLWEWGSRHPRQRCDQCQLIKHPLPVECEGCRGSSEAAFYCSASCAKRDKQRHQQTCDLWKRKLSPNK